MLTIIITVAIRCAAVRYVHSKEFDLTVHSMCKRPRRLRRLFLSLHHQELKMTDSISYRRATIDDIFKICELGQILNAIHHLARPDIYADATTVMARDKPHWISSVQEEDRATFLAELGSKAIGFITVQVVQPISPLLQQMAVGRIGSVAVSEQLRGRGIGSTLMKLAEEWARKRGATDVRLAVWAFNEQAVDLYRELGYEIRAFEMGKRIQAPADLAADGQDEARA
ncbi:GNAT family N-acetyltransferase [Paraburkholderia sp. XV]|nr:GNAT family N-acetyltransferase [Paraburkholderia sp. XV]